MNEERTDAQTHVQKIWDQLWNAGSEGAVKTKQSHTGALALLLCIPQGQVLTSLDRMFL